MQNNLKRDVALGLAIFYLQKCGKRQVAWMDACVEFAWQNARKVSGRQ